MRCKVGVAVLAPLCGHAVLAAELHLNERDYFDTQGLSVLAYQNTFHPVFRDQKLGGIEMILHGERIATDGEVRPLRLRSNGIRFRRSPRASTVRRPTS